jgi:RNA polymerase-binding transcription factor DksA
MNFSEEERAEFEEQLADVDQKVVLVQILMELKAINEALREPRQEEESINTYLCTACGDPVPAEKRQTHAQQQHGAPADLPVEDLGMFTEA